MDRGAPLTVLAAAAVLAAGAPALAGAASVEVRVDPGTDPALLGAGAEPALAPGAVTRLERASGEDLSGLRRLFRVAAAGPAAAARLAGRLDAEPGVEAAVAPAPAPPPATCRVPPAGGWPALDPLAPTPDLSPLQDYRAGLAMPDGAAGEGVRIADLEYDWRVSHEELASRALPRSVLPAAGLPPGFFAEDHGTAVLGILGADADAEGVTGLAHEAAIAPLSPFLPANPEVYDPAGAIVQAAAGLRAGDVLLIEQQINLFSTPLDRVVLAPVEGSLASRDVIRAVVGAGIVVVEPAANQGIDLALTGRSWLADPADPATTGALIVAGGGSAETGNDLRRAGSSNFGARVDVQGYGEGVLTAGYGLGLGTAQPRDRAYTACFDGTSSAAATVAGAAAALQELAVARVGAPLSPAALRDALVATGIPHAGPAAEPIGPRPQVAAAAALIPPPVLAAEPPPAPPAPAAAAVVASPPPAVAAPPRRASPARGIRARFDPRTGTLVIRLAGLAPRAVVRVAGHRARAVRGGVVVRRVRPGRRLALVVSAPPGRARAYARTVYRIVVPARGAVRVLLTSLASRQRP